MYKKFCLACCLIAACVFIGHSQLWAAHAGSVQERLGNLEEKLNKLGDDKLDSLRSASEFIDRLNMKVKIGIWGVHETEYDEDEGDNTDIELDTLEIYFKTDLNDWVHGYVELEYDDDDDSIKGEEARIIFHNEDKCPVYAAFGKFEAIPFGYFETFQIEDSITEDLGETKEIAGMIGFEQSGFQIEASLFQPDDVTEEGDEDKTLDTFSVAANYKRKSGPFSLDVGASYINNYGDAGDLPDLLATDEVDSYVGGMCAHAILGWQGLYLIGEYITALDEFETDEMLFDGNGAQPNGFNLELAYETEIQNHEAIFAIAYQGTDEAISSSDIDDTLPESRIAASVGFELFKNVSLAFEFMHDENYSKDDFADAGWSPADYDAVADGDRQTFITELALAF